MVTQFYEGKSLNAAEGMFLSRETLESLNIVLNVCYMANTTYMKVET